MLAERRKIETGAKGLAKAKTRLASPCPPVRLCCARSTIPTLQIRRQGGLKQLWGHPPCMHLPMLLIAAQGPFAWPHDVAHGAPCSSGLFCLAASLLMRRQQRHSCCLRAMQLAEYHIGADGASAHRMDTFSLSLETIWHQDVSPSNPCCPKTSS